MGLKRVKVTSLVTEIANLRQQIGQYARQDELQAVAYLLKDLKWEVDQASRIVNHGRILVERIRNKTKNLSLLSDFFNKYQLSSQEGVVLLCLSEALLRIPDALTANLIIQDKLTKLDMSSLMNKSGSFIVNASTLVLRHVNNFLSWDDSLRLKDKDLQDVRRQFWGILGRLIVRVGEPVIRKAIQQGITILGSQFILAENLTEALEASEIWREQGYLFSYDMLGEAARTFEDAEVYYQAYLSAIQSLAQDQKVVGDPVDSPGISVKLSALTPRFEESQVADVHRLVLPRMKALCLIAANAGLHVILDAEEAKHLELTLDILEALAGDPTLANWNGLGIAVQAYQKRTPKVIEWIAELGKIHHRRIMVRLVKGAYWDGEIKQAQVEGFDDYPVYTKKAYTDVSYLACAQKLLALENVYPMFATHNAVTLAAIYDFAGNRTDWEFQKLFGMGDELYNVVKTSADTGRFFKCRIYAPVGVYRELLPYLVRRLLENGANSSFLHKLYDESTSIDVVVADPVETARRWFASSPEAQRLIKPKDIFGKERTNSEGIDFSDRGLFKALQGRVESYTPEGKKAYPLIAGTKSSQGEWRKIVSPGNHALDLGQFLTATSGDVSIAMNVAGEAFRKWNHLSAAARAKILIKAADLLEKELPKFIALLIHESGKTYTDAVAEVREAVDFCRYYAAHGLQLFDAPMCLKGATGEYNEHALTGRGVFVAISPWNFPLAIFMGQITAALMAGNTVVAKPAEQAPHIAFEAVRLLHEAGVPGTALHLVLGRGAEIGTQLLAHPNLAGVVFTGSFEVAKQLQRQLAERPGPILPLIAETGGLNAMIVDSSALLEQVVDDVMTSAFRSAGQRCSCARILYVQEDVADDLIRMLSGAMEALVIGEPHYLKTDVGPVINADAQQRLESHLKEMEGKAKVHTRLAVPEPLKGSYFGPVLLELENGRDLKQEVFGPILHVVRYSPKKLSDTLDEIQQMGYGLTLGIHSRIDHTIDFIAKRMRVGNIYVNRNMIGAVVGVQPFGGEGLSGTGPKAGGVYYLLRFATERVLTVNTTAVGGNVELLTAVEM